MGAQQSTPPPATTEDRSALAEQANNTTTELFSAESASRIRKGIFKSFHHLLNTREFTDLLVVAGNEQVRCHSFILCACSNYFARLLMNQGDNTNTMIVTLNSISKSTFELILKGLYSGSNIITTDNVIDLCRASRQLEIDFLYSECEQFIVRHPTVANVVEIHQSASRLGLERMPNAIHRLIVENFETFKDSSIFMMLPFEDVLALVDHQDLSVTSEDIVVDTILKWVTHNQGENRSAYIGRLVSAARLCLVQPACLQMLMTCRTVQENSVAQAAVGKAIYYQLDIGQRHGHWPPSAVYRNNGRYQNVAVAGSRDGSISILSLPHCLSSDNIQPQLATISGCMLMTIFDNSLYALASTNSPVMDISPVSTSTNVARNIPQSNRNTQDMPYQRNTSQLYVFNDHAWQHVTEVPISECILVSHGESIYFVNSLDHTVLKLDRPFHGRQARGLENVSCDGDCFIVSCIPYKENILVFCSNRTRSGVSTIHCLNTVSQSWSRLRDINGPAKIYGVQHDDDFFVVQTNGAVSKIRSEAGSGLSFQLIGNLWPDHIDLNVRGCICLKDTLIVCYCSDQECQKKISLTGVFETINYHRGSLDFFVPAILPRNIS